MRTVLREARKNKNMSVEDIATEVEISASFYYKIEAGIRNPTIDLAKKIADLLGRTVDELFFAPQLDEMSKMF
ncbi:helix-turn-helix transcriptional regulator [Paenibacillus naphthalenovorans]|uniref:helix-turn-helix transcriptional regulator n=1 Tax=Paenibacillus naphthalenovorans TaxID=162209 RepID=UPI003D27094E